MKNLKLFLLLLLCFCISCEKDTLPEDGSESTTENIHSEIQLTTKPLEYFQQTDTRFSNAYKKLYTKSKGFPLKGNQILPFTLKK